jgi:beta-N-acetylhexosaminidase
MFRVVGSPSFHKIASEISDASVTLLHNKMNLIPVASSTRMHVVTVTEEPASWPGTEFVNEIRPWTRSVGLSRISNDTGEERIKEIVREAEQNDVLVVGVYLSVLAWKSDRRFAPPLDRFLSRLPLLRVPVILVAYGDPYVLGKLPETAGVMTPYNGTYLGEESIARAIAGKIRTTGKLPVTIPGRYPRSFGLVTK